MLSVGVLFFIVSVWSQTLLTKVNTLPQTSALSSILALPEYRAYADLLNSTNVQLTLFAPDSSTLVGIDPVDPAVLDALKQTLRLHIIPKVVHMSDFPGFAHTILKDPSLVNLGLGIPQVLIFDDVPEVGAGFTRANPTLVDLAASNGVMHVIDTLLQIPPTVITQLVDSGLSDMKNLFDQTNLTTLVDTTPHITVFAVVAAGFLSLQTTPSQRTVKYHIVPWTVYSKNLPNGTILPTLAGQTLTIINNQTGMFVQTPTNTAQFIFADMTAKNGVVHVIDNVLQL
jgi:uncharacterized surface protein with fasciclin (FAS1) repeats